jgi:hypothetical protein
MHTDYQGRTAATPAWADGTAATGPGEVGHDYLDRIVDHFWSSVQRTSTY